MAKAKFDYATENVVRRGDELAQYSAKPADAVHLVMVRRFDPARLELGSWVQASEHTQNETKAQEQFTFIADHMRSEGALSVVWVQVNNWHPVTNPEYKIGKYNCTGTIRDVRSSAMLQADGGVPRNVALDAIGLAIAVNNAMTGWIDSQSQTGDDAAKDQRDAGLPTVESQPVCWPGTDEPITAEQQAQTAADNPAFDATDNGTVEHEMVETVDSGTGKHKRAKARKAS